MPLTIYFFFEVSMIYVVSRYVLCYIAFVLTYFVSPMGVQLCIPVTVYLIIEVSSFINNLLTNLKAMLLLSDL